MPGWSTVLSQNTQTSVATLLYTGRVTITAIRTINTAATTAYLHVFDTNEVVSLTTPNSGLSTVVPRWWVVAPTLNASDGDGLPTDGIVFENGIAIASTTAFNGLISTTQHVRIGIR